MAAGRIVAACSGDVEVTGVPESIRLDVPFCVPPKQPTASVDAGRSADTGTDAEATDSGED